MPEDALIALIPLPFSLMFTVFTVLAAHQCARHQSFQPKEKISHLILIVLVPFFGAVWWFEAAEKRKDAQLSREVEFALPRELPKKDNIKLAREFVKAEFVEKGMIADLNVHWDRRA